MVKKSNVRKVNGKRYSYSQNENWSGKQCRIFTVLVVVAKSEGSVDYPHGRFLAIQARLILF